MRLVCPNCEAKYEVPEDAIPETGRDVQCANCGHAWFQMRARASAVDATPAVASDVTQVQAPVDESVVDEPVVEAAAVEEVVSVEVVTDREIMPAPVVEPDAVPTPEWVALPEEDARPEHEVPAADPASEPVSNVPQIEVEPEIVPGAGPAPSVPETAAADVEGALLAAPAAEGAAPYAVDDSVLAILREEAERESRARQVEAARALETQTELGIEQAMPVASKVPEVVAEDPALVARRTRLPDVEEINSTLRPAEAPSDDDAFGGEPTAAEGRSSFRSGFLLVMTLAIIGSAIYGSADAIADMVPALAGPLQSYVAIVDSLRLQLDGLMQSATVAINGT